jgi:hypothetical protein
MAHFVLPFCSYVRYEYLRELTVKNTIFWNVILCSLVDVYQHFAGTYCLHHQSRWAAHSTETLINFNHATQHHIQEDNILHVISS